MAASRAAKMNETPSRLRAELAQRILQHLKQQGAEPGHHLVEQDLCAQFSVSRTPIRGALKLLEAEGAIAPRPNRGFVLARPIKETPQAALAKPQDEEARRLFIDIAQARNTNTLPDEIAQQELVRRFDAKLPVVLRVLRQRSPCVQPGRRGPQLGGAGRDRSRRAAPARSRAHAHGESASDADKRG